MSLGTLHERTELAPAAVIAEALGHSTATIKRHAKASGADYSTSKESRTMPSRSKHCAYVDFPDPEGPHMKITWRTDVVSGRPWTGPMLTLPGAHDEFRRVSSWERSIPVIEHVGDAES